MSNERVVSVSVDLDPLSCYYRIHALPEGAPPDRLRHVILRRCLPRLAELFAARGVKATFFVVGSDLEEDTEGRALLAQLARDGHELANHTHRHPYELTRLGHDRMSDEIDRAHEAIAACAGIAPVGFRSPGYETTHALIELLCARGYLYDSSTFPSVPNYAAKAAVMAALRLRGRRSGSLLATPRVLLAPRVPYRPSATDPYRRGDQPIVELPMAVTRWLRLPVIGTSVISFPEVVRRSLVGAALRDPLFNFELHGIDVADAQEDDLPSALVGKQPDLRITGKRKREALASTLRECAQAGAMFVPLRDAAARAAGWLGVPAVRR